MNKIVYLIVLVLAVFVGYQSLELNKLKKELIKKSKEPEVIIHIEKVEPRSSTQKRDVNKSIDRVIKEDFQKIFKDIFGNKEVKDGIKQSVNEFKKGLNQAITQLQKQLKDMDKDSGNIFNDIIKEFGALEHESFHDMGDYYQYIVNVDGSKSRVDINAKNGYLYIDITSKQEKKEQNSVIKKQSQRSYIIKLPNNGLVEKIKSEYKDKKLYITIPKVKAKVKA